MTPEEALFASIADLAPLIEKRKLSPVALAEASLAKLETEGRSLNAVVNVMRERALAEARAVEKDLAAGKKRGPLQGIPYGVKDLLAAKGAPTTWGSSFSRTRRSTRIPRWFAGCGGGSGSRRQAFDD